MAGDLTLRITVTEIETLQKNRLHVAGECGRRGRCGHQHFVAAVDQVPRAGLMKRRCELVVDVPAIMVSMAVEKGAKTAVVWLLFTLPLSLLEGVFSQNGPQRSRARRCCAAKRTLHGEDRSEILD